MSPASDPALSYLELKDNRLHSILELTNAINANMAVEQLYRIFTFILKEQLHFSRFALLHHQETWTLAAKSGYKRKIGPEELALELVRFKEITLVESSNSSLLEDFQAVIPISHHDRTLAYLLLATPSKMESLEAAHFSFAQTLTNILTVALENRKLSAQNVIKEQISKELELASEMQKLLFPQELPSNKKMDISGRYIPRHAVGGDFYDFHFLDENHIQGFSRSTYKLGLYYNNELISLMTFGYRKTNRGTKGVRTMSLKDGDQIISVKQIPDLSDQLFMLTKSGMMIRLAANQTKETLGKVAKGTRIMELRNPDKTGYNDEIIFVARLPAELLEGDNEEETNFWVSFKA